ncbi:hypothetical protein JK232_07345 [Nissabacter archeti]|uniref:DUF6966 domain-containing protein n=1 Tax=Nissabacter archeti TaxID=1917880 RepID=A0ABS5JFI5_9GAMM|nr:hypothetical protein [Nissabacter archeti]MBS0968706.1 hypothetical protein [Nissabacter archeti]
MKEEIKKLMMKIIVLLAESDEALWVNRFEWLNYCIDTHYDDALYEIKQLFGSANSFNDLILHRNGYMLKKENDELSSLQDELYSLLKKEIANRNAICGKNDI